MQPEYDAALLMVAVKRCSVNEEGLYDYVVFNNELEDALAQLRDIAEQALAGLSGQGAKLSKARAAADATAASPKVCIDCFSATPHACFPLPKAAPNPLSFALLLRSKHGQWMATRRA